MTTREVTVGQGTILRFETGKLAKQAGGSVIVRSGDSVVLVTACRAANAREGIDFLPLTVDYREYTYASGRIPGGFFKREGKPADKDEVGRMFESGRMRHDKVHNAFTALLQKDKAFTRENFGAFFTKKDAFSTLWANYRKLLGK